MKIASVVIDSTVRRVDKIFDYIIPENLQKAQVGMRVKVPFSGKNRKESGYIIKIYEKEKENLKEIEEILDKEPFLTRERIFEAYWIKERYFCTFAEALRLFMPAGVKGKSSEEVQKHITLVKLCKGADTSDALKFPAQARIIKILQETPEIPLSDLCVFASAARSSVESLKRKGILTLESVTVFRNPNADRHIKKDKKPTLTPLQEKAFKQIYKTFKNPEKPILLHGVTGSGKTELYLNIIEKALEENKSAIVTVPEISLTHQMVERFTSRFGDKVALLHSALSKGERYDEWQRLLKGEAKIAIGARSAIFAPCKNLGVIIIDEEHDDSYKSEMGVRYNAREVAECRAKTEGAAVVFASATPDVTSYYRAQSGVYSLVKMEERVAGAELPDVEIVDMRKELEEGNRSPFSKALADAIRERIEKNEQTILFLNRRGHSTFVSCRSCGFVAKCPHCSISLTYHSFTESLLCHYCGYRIKKHELCPECGSKHVHGFGTGTQKIEEKLAEEFPSASVLRMDLDTTGTKGAHEKILEKFKEKNINILLGTQMISKGLDFQNVTLVGVLSADQALNMGDYRAQERAFDIITQVCGRAGRGKNHGKAFIQTYMPDNTTVINAANQDYEEFYKEEILIRKALRYPPFCDILNFVFTSNNEEDAKKAAQRVCDKVLNELIDKVRLFTPMPCSINKVNNIYRWHFWIKCNYDKEISKKIADILSDEKGVIVDLNPTAF